MTNDEMAKEMAAHVEDFEKMKRDVGFILWNQRLILQSLQSLMSENVPSDDWPDSFGAISSSAQIACERARQLWPFLGRVRNDGYVDPED